MVADMGFQKGVLLFCHHSPLRRTRGRPGQQQLVIGGTDAEMADLRRGQSAAPDDAIARHPRPTGFYKELPHAVGEGDEAPYHGRVANPKSMAVSVRDLNARPVAIGLTRVVQETLHEPVDSGLPQQVVGISQGEVIGDVPAAGQARSLLSLLCLSVQYDPRSPGIHKESS